MTEQMTATKIRETKDGTLYKLSEPMEHGFIEGDCRAETGYVLIEYRTTGIDNTIVWPAEEDGSQIDEATSPTWTLRHVTHGEILEELGYEIVDATVAA